LRPLDLACDPARVDGRGGQGGGRLSAIVSRTLFDALGLPTGENSIECANKAIDVIIEVPSTIHRDSMPVREIAQRRWKLANLRHSHASYQDGNDRNLPLERYLYFYADRVSLIVDSILNSFDAAEPPWPYNNQQDVSSPKCLGNLNSKIDSGLNIIDVAKNRALTVVLHQTVKNTAGNILRIRSAI
jgi:hypothetical protein